MDESQKERTEFEARAVEAEARASEAERNMIQAAKIGKELLERNNEVESELERLRSKMIAEMEEKEQDRYTFQLKAKNDADTIMSLQQELESVRTEFENRKETDFLQTEIVSLKSRLHDSQSALHEKTVKETRYQEEIREFKEELSNWKREYDRLRSSTSNSDDSFTANEHYFEWQEEKQKLEKEISTLKEELEFATIRYKDQTEENARLKVLLEEKECELTNSIRSLDSARRDNSEMSVEMESLKLAGGLNPESKGNSLFSEVEDRRALVEHKLQILQSKNAELKKICEEKTQQIHRVKMQNLTLLNMAGGNGGFRDKKASASQIQRLEELLTAEQNLTKTLKQRLDVLSQSNELSKSPTSSSSPESRDYAYMSSLLKERSCQIEELKRQLQQQIRQTLEESDKVQDLTRKLNVQETQTSRLRAEIYQLKISIEDLKNEKDIKPVKNKVQTQVVYEDIKFDDEKERVDKENLEPLKNKKWVSLCPSVKVIEGAGFESVVELKKEDSKEKPKSSGGRKHQSAIRVDEHDEQMKNECAQQ